MFPLRINRPRELRRGTAIVETAFVLPVFLLLLFAMLEFSHALMVKNVLRGACRSAARMASTGGLSTTDIESYVKQMVGSAISADNVLVFVKDASSFDQGGAVSSSGAAMESLPDMDLANAESRALFMVRARVNYIDAALVPMPFSTGIVLEGQAFTRIE